MKNFEARIILENGLSASKLFDDYRDMCQWLAENGQAGIAAWDMAGGGKPVDQVQLQSDVAALQA